MMSLFKNRTLAARLRMSLVTTSLGALTGVVAGFPVPVQAQDSQTQLIITKVEVNYASSQLIIHGQNFGTASGIPPVVKFMGTGVGVVTYDTAKVIISVPLAFLEAGSYLLTMSTGPSIEQNDSFNVTLGAQGPKGDTGPQGSSGAQGPQGLKGDKGDKGDTGPQGSSGAQGPQGLKGDKGDTGPQGSQGDTGPRGATGAQGALGPKGDKGATGPQGPSGPGAVVIKTDISALTDLNPRCTSAELVSINCNRAIRDYCTHRGYLVGFGPTGYDSTTRDIAFVCLRQ